MLVCCTVDASYVLCIRHLLGIYEPKNILSTFLIRITNCYRNSITISNLYIQHKPNKTEMGLYLNIYHKQFINIIFWNIYYIYMMIIHVIHKYHRMRQTLWDVDVTTHLLSGFPWRPSDAFYCPTFPCRLSW